MAEDTRYRTDYSAEPYRSEPDRPEAPAHAPSGDPLTELARLIGQNDPFADMKSRRAGAYDSAGHDVGPAPQWLARASSSYDQNGYEQTDNRDAGYAEPYGAPQAAYMPRATHLHQHDAPRYDQSHVPAADSAYEQDHRYADDRHADPQYADSAAYAAESEPAGDDRYRVTPPSDYDNEGYYDDGHLPPRSDDQGSALANPRRGGLITIAAVLGLAVIGTAGAFAYRAFTGPGDGPAPVIKASTTPDKIPAAPAADPNKPIQDRIGGANPVQTERIVPREEPPVPQPVAPRAGAPAPAAAAPPRAGTPGPAAAAPLPATPASPNEPKKVKTVTIKQEPGGEITSTAPAKATPSAPAPRPTTPPTKQKGTPLTLAPGTEPAPAAPRPAAAGAYVVQLSSQKTETEARDSYRSMQTKYPTVLGGREAIIRRADLDKGTYYRVQIGSFADMASATSFCDNLKAAGGQCVVQKN